MLTGPEPLLPTRGYRVLCHDATLIDLEAARRPTSSQRRLTSAAPRESWGSGIEAPQLKAPGDVVADDVCGVCTKRDRGATVVRH